MKKLIVPAVLIFLVSCKPNNEMINKKIEREKAKIEKISEKIESLEEKLSVDTSEVEIYKTVVKIAKLENSSFSHYISVSGKAEAVEEAFISPEMNGQIRKIHVKEGEYVKKGQTLITLNTDVIEKSIAEVQAGLSLSEKMYEKQKNLWEQEIGSEIQYLQAKTNYESAKARLASLQEQLAMGSIEAPFAGIVENISSKEGELASPGMPVLHLVNLHNLKVEANVSESYLSSIKEGEEVELSFPSYSGISLEVPIIRVGSVIDDLSRTFIVEVRIDNRNQKIKPNQLALMKINDFHSDDALVVPSIIIKQDITGYYLYKVAKNNEGLEVASKVYVKPGLSYGDQTMITEGLKEGMKIIVDGYNLVKTGSPIEIIESV